MLNPPPPPSSLICTKTKIFQQLPDNIAVLTQRTTFALLNSFGGQNLCMRKPKPIQQQRVHQ